MQGGGAGVSSPSGIPGTVDIVFPVPVKGTFADVENVNNNGINRNNTRSTGAGVSDSVGAIHDWSDIEQEPQGEVAAEVMYNFEMTRVEAEKSLFRQRSISRQLELKVVPTTDSTTAAAAPPPAEQDLRSYFLHADQSAVVDTAVKLVEFLQSKNMDKDAEAILREFLPGVQLQIAGGGGGDNLEMTHKNIRAILDAGLERFIRRIKAKVRTVEVPMEVRLKNFSYKADVIVTESAITTIASSLVQMINPFSAQKKNKAVLNDINTIFRPGSLTLILGLPGCGKTSLLKALSGNLFTSKQSKISGELLINGEQNAGEFHMKRIASYVEQRETHLPLMTVRETLEFAHKCMVPAATDGSVDMQVDLILHVLGLYHTGNTLVGNELIRGVSGGERRRVTLAEMMSGAQRILCLDEITTGLDSAAAFDIINALRLTAHELSFTIVTALLQPLPDTFALFDDILMLKSGNVVFHGPARVALDHFAALGFIRPPRMDVGDFLLEVTGEDASHLFVPRQEGEKPPRIEEMVAAWKANPLYRQIEENLAKPSKFSHATDEMSRKLFTNPYALTPMETLKLCFNRQVTLTRRNTALIQVKFGQSIIMGIISGSLFYKMGYNNFQLRYGFIFLSTLTLTLGHSAAIPDIVKEAAVFFKQHRAHFFGIFPFLFSTTLFQIPIILLETTIFTGINYWMSGMSGDNNGIHFAVFWMLVVLTSLTMCMLYRCVSFASPSAEVAITVSNLFTVISCVFAGFMIPRSQIPDYWIWAYWGTPVAWTLRALAINEFKSNKFDVQLATGETLGDVYLQAFDFQTETKWIGFAFIFLAACCVGFIVLSYFGLRYSKFGAPRAVETIRRPAAPILSPTLPSVNLPFQPITFSFYDIKYTVKAKRGRELTILNGVSGYARPGTITALMGSSGAGKTTLLDVLAGRKNTGTIEGRILVNGYPKDDITFSRVTGYVEQMDIHTPTTTVREALAFSAQLRLPASVSKDEAMAFVQQVIDILDLGEIADRIVGTKENGGLSTEQMKRLTIGVELVANPSLLFLDEPTSGLDSRGAAIVMRAVKNIAATGRSIICTIHQPSTELFEMFDRLLLLQRGGTITYFGNIGPHSETLIRHFESIPGTPMCKPDENPASYMLDAIGAGVGRAAKSDYAAVYASSHLAAENERVLRSMLTPPQGVQKITFETQYARSQPDQLRALLKKDFRSYWRMPEYNLSRVLFLVVMALIFGSLYFKNDPTSRGGAFARISVLYVATMFVGVVNINTIAGVMVRERAVFYRERAAGMYSSFMYSLSSGVVEIPYLLFNSVLFCSIFYWMVDFKGSGANFFFFNLCFYLFTSLCTYFGQLIAVLTPNAAVAQALSGSIISIWAMFCGYATPRPDIPNYYLFLYYLSPLTYYLEAVITDQFHCDSTECFSVNMIDDSGNASSIPSDDFISASFGMHYSNRWWDILVLVGFVVAIRIGVSLGTVYINHSTR